MISMQEAATGLHGLFKKLNGLTILDQRANLKKFGNKLFWCSLLPVLIHTAYNARKEG